MSYFKTIALLFVAALHIGFAVLEILLWQTSIGLNVFDLTPAFAAETHSLAMNQGLYNLFLAAGLGWAALSSRRDLGIFFAACVVVAGVFGAVTVSPTIAVVQALPGAVALLLVMLSPSR